MGIGAIQGIAEIPAPTQTSEIIKIVVQLVIGVITVWKMLKKPKNTDSNQQNQ
ncbi:hypothetical protein SAMN04487979_14515 [Flavobacterium sp. ov086]|nr:hypothetical protein SAMN04487979_14515 [Flavobacterium sp. ov086]